MPKLGKKDELHFSGLSKREVYGWAEPGETGKFAFLDKTELHVDSAYQRQSVSAGRVRAIGVNFCWAGFGVILVAIREGKHYVFDGQHRVLGAMRRDDIGKLPCLVFEFDSLTEEARAFVIANTIRGPVSALQKFHANITAEDPDATSIAAILDEYGYYVPANAWMNGGGVAISCVEALYRSYDFGAEHLRHILSVSRKLYGDNVPNGKMVKAFSYLDRHLQRHSNEYITRADVVEKILAIGEKELLKSMVSMSEALGRSGAKIWCAGIVQRINIKKRSKRIPSIFGE